jgi:hypothetical protein
MATTSKVVAKAAKALARKVATPANKAADAREAASAAGREVLRTTKKQTFRGVDTKYDHFYTLTKQALKASEMYQVLYARTVLHMSLTPTCTQTHFLALCNNYRRQAETLHHHQGSSHHHPIIVTTIALQFHHTINIPSFHRNTTISTRAGRELIVAIHQNPEKKAKFEQAITTPKPKSNTTTPQPAL